MDIEADRKIYIIGDIDHEAYLKFTRKMTRLEEEGAESIHIVLMSDGGNPEVALAFHDRIKMSKCKVTITGTGLVASAAGLILVAPGYRTMTKNSWLMVHPTTLHKLGGKNINDIRQEVLNASDTDQQWNELLAEATGKTPDFWEKKQQKETYLSAEECLELGVIQEII